MGLFSRYKVKKMVINGQDIYAIDKDTRIALTEKGIRYEEKFLESPEMYNDSRTQIMFAFADVGDGFVSLEKLAEKADVDIKEAKIAIRRLLLAGLVQVEE